MILDNHLDVSADPDAVFALINDVERVAGCLPGATLDGSDGDAYLGRVTFKVGPVKAAYAGRIRFTEVVPDERRLRLSARGADAHGNGDAEAEVALTVTPSGRGSALDLHTDLVVRGRIAQFGKGAITAVSGRVLDQFARNLAAQLETPEAGAASASSKSPPAAAPVVQPAAPASDEPLDGLAVLLPPQARRIAGVAAVAAVAFVQGWLFGRLRTQDRLIKELRRGR